MVGLFKVTDGNGLTVMVVFAELLHPLASVPVTVYTVVTVGSAMTMLPAVEERSVLGDHVYETAPDADNVVLDPAQISAGGLTVTTGELFTITSTFVLGPSQLLLLTWLTQKLTVPATAVDGIGAEGSAVPPVGVIYHLN
jgi:hypothetical protein